MSVGGVAFSLLVFDSHLKGRILAKEMSLCQ